MDRLWGEVLPVPAASMTILAGGERIAAGKTRTRLVHLAARRVQMRIDAALRASRVMEHGDGWKS
jgi:hypothetical protein